MNKIKNKSVFPKRRRMFPRTVKPSIWKKFKWKFEKIRTFMKNFIPNIIMVCQWIPVLWNNWDWDFNFLFIILRHKLQKMSKHIKEHDVGVTSWQRAAQMQACADILDRLLENEYDKKEQEEHEKKWGETIYDTIDDGGIGLKLDIYSQKARDLGQEDLERKEQMEIYNLSAKRRQKDLDILFRIMRNRVEWWWD